MNIFKWIFSKPKTERKVRFHISNLDEIGRRDPNAFLDLEDALHEQGVYPAQIRADLGYLDVIIDQNDDAPTELEVSHLLQERGFIVNTGKHT